MIITIKIRDHEHRALLSALRPRNLSVSVGVREALKLAYGIGIEVAPKQGRPRKKTRQ